MRAFITGINGSLGRALFSRLHATIWGVDLEHVDIRDPDAVAVAVESFAPDVIFHLAAAKHAPEGEENPDGVARTNIDGTRNILATGVRTILASTCKAADPETAYGASKLIAERMVLNASGTVIRFYNIPESQGNVFRLWESLPEDAPIPWTDCWRYFVPMATAVDLLVAAADFLPGRYAPNPGDLQHMRSMAIDLYPGRELIQVPRRRGDRKREPRFGASETLHDRGWFSEITSPHDHAAVEAVAA